ncbi:MAG: hypothetical protein ACYC23_00885 [Limisphaerales bacterium]
MCVNNQSAPARGLLRLLVVLAAPLCALPVPAAEWIRAGLNTDLSHWGLRDRLQFAIHSSGLGGPEDGSRGLIRLGYPILTIGGHALVNTIAVEPVVASHKAFSELSRLDGTAGQRFFGITRQSPPAMDFRSLPAPKP